MTLVLFGGKGGVGKTTCAAAAAVHLADAGRRTLLVSTDPAHSLSDALQQPIGPEVRPVEGVPNLCALEICAERLLAKLQTEHGAQIRHVLETGTYLDEEDLDDLFTLSLPGLDEMMALAEIVDLIERDPYDLYLLDTAPTGHALRLLALPDLVDEWIRILARLRYKYRHLVGRLARREIREPADDLLFSMKKAVRKIDGLLHDPDRCEFVVVTMPEEMVVAETRRLVAELSRLKIPLRRLVVNRVVSGERTACSLCHQRRQNQKGLLEECERAFPGLTIIHLLERPHPVEGIPCLRDLQFPAAGFGEPLVALAGASVA